MTKDSKNISAITRSSAAEYLTFIAASGDQETSVEMRYENENIWLTQKMLAELYGVSVPAVNQHLKRIFEDGELNENSVIKDYLITAADGKNYSADWATRLDGFLEFNGNEILTGPGKISQEEAKLHAETEFEKYRITQDRLYTSDFDRFLEEQAGSYEA